MTKDEKRQILLGRLNGLSIREIADKLGYQHYQTIHLYIKRLLASAGVERGQLDVKRPELTHQQMLDLADAIVRLDGNIPLIKSCTQYQDLPVKEALAYIGSRFTVKRQDEAYPSVQEWRRRTGTTMVALAEQMGMSHSTASHILSGRTHLRLKRARRLEQVTNLSLRQIYRGQIAVVDKAIETLRAAKDQAEPGEIVVIQSEGRHKVLPRRAGTIIISGDDQIVFPPKKKRRVQV